jgi:antitoxin component YwqK of YwqJK toxin-antitoxin module
VDKAKKQRVPFSLPTLNMPWMETNGTDVVRTIYFPNGQPMDRIHGYMDDFGDFIKHGSWETWTKSGTRELYGHFENDVLDGARFEWNHAGKLSSISVYNHGDLIEYHRENLESHPEFKTAQRLASSKTP